MPYGIPSPTRLVWLCPLMLYFPVLFQLYTARWETVDYTHAYFILPVSLWLAWRKRDRFLPPAAGPAQGQGYWLAAIVLGLLVFIFGWRWDYASVMTFSLVPVVSGICGYLYGNRAVKILSFPILYLLLMIPPPAGILDSVTLPMRRGVSVACEALLGALHYPVSREGLLLSIGGHQIYMGAPCSGFRSLITMIALGLAYVYIGKASFGKKAIMLFSVVPFAVIGNLLRVFSVCLVTFHKGDAVGRVYHDYSGYFIFLFLIAGLVGMEALLGRAMKQ